MGASSYFQASLYLPSRQVKRMYSIKDLESTLGMSYERIRTRISNLSDSFDDVTETGKRGKILVTDTGLSLLKRLRELEKEGISVEAGIEEIRKELQSPDGNGDITGLKVSEGNSEVIQVLKEEIQFLRNELEKRDQQIQQLLPGPKEKGVIRRIWEWIW